MKRKRRRANCKLRAWASHGTPILALERTVSKPINRDTVVELWTGVFGRCCVNGATSLMTCCGMKKCPAEI
jgi:hypothetical protein